MAAQAVSVPATAMIDGRADGMVQVVDALHRIV